MTMIIDASVVAISFVALTFFTGCTSGLPADVDARCRLGSGGPRLAFEVVPGGGWDNLRNLDMDQAMDTSYSQCQTTEDGKYLIPDDMQVVPVKSSHLETFAETFEHWSSYTSSLSASVNAHGSGIIEDILPIAASFSGEYQSVKSHQYLDDSFTTRVQVRYSEYVAKLKVGSKLSHDFKRRLRKIAALHTLNATDSARYESQLLVRDYGTHVITSMKTGAIISQTDNFQRKIISESESNKFSIRSSVSVGFFGLFDFGVGASFSKSSSSASSLDQSRTSSSIQAYGGPRFRPKNFSAAEWSDGVADNLVAIDRDGQPLYDFVNDVTLPKVPPSVLFRVYNYVKDAVNVYYKHNTYSGCTDRDAPNFSFKVNADDGTCKPTTENFSFGGVYQTCTQSGSDYQDVCADMQQKNVLTDAYSCPEGYEPVLMQEESKYVVFTHHDCHRCYIIAHCCHDNPYSATAYYTTYWCAAKEAPAAKLLFGGTFTDQVSNTYTHGKFCPKTFGNMRLLEDLYVCYSEDLDNAMDYSLPFAGFFSCKSGNQLIKNTPRSCPKGYSQHLAANDRGCDIYFCMKSSAIKSIAFPGINLPPYMKTPKDAFLHTKTSSYALSSDGEVWTALTGDEKEMPLALMSLLPADIGPTTTETTSSPQNWLTFFSSKTDSTPSPTSTMTATTTTCSTQKPGPPESLLSSSKSEESRGSPGSGLSVSDTVLVSVGSTVVCIGAIVLAYMVYRKRRPDQSYAQI